MTIQSLVAFRKLSLFALLAVTLLPMQDVLAAPQPARPGIVIAYHTTPANWHAFQRMADKSLLPYFRALKQAGVLADFRLLLNRNLDSASWNAMAILDFKGARGLARWNERNRSRPAGLLPGELSLTTSVDSTPVDLVRAGRAKTAAKRPVFLMIPYKYLVSESAYRRYLDCYTIPQLQGWVRAGILARYAIVMDKYPAGRPWNAMLVLEYRSDAALARRDAVKASVRAKLAHNTVWKKIAEEKSGIRDELLLTVADDIERR